MLHQDEDIGAAVCGPVFITEIYGPPTVERIDKIGVVQRREMTKAKHAVVTIIDPRVGKEMSSEARHQAKKLSNEMEPHTLCMCFIVEGSGFFPAMVRSVVAGIQLLTNQKNPWKVVSGVDDGVKFLGTELAKRQLAFDTAELVAALEAVKNGGKKEAAA
jgi:hypothetical protein